MVRVAEGNCAGRLRPPQTGSVWGLGGRPLRSTRPLARIDVDSYREGGFFASALVIGFVQNQPSEAFFGYARQVGLLRANGEAARMEFWMDQMRRARAWFSTHNL